MKHTRPSEASQRSFSCHAIVTATHISSSAGRLNQRMFCRSSLVAAADQPKCDFAQPPPAADVPQQFQREKHPGGLRQPAPSARHNSEASAAAVSRQPR